MRLFGMVPFSSGTRVRPAGTSQGGFTLIELLVYLAIVGVASTIGLALVVSLVEADARGQVRDVVDSSMSRAQARLTEAVHAALAINLGDSRFDSEDGQLSLTMRDAGRSPTVFAINAGRLTVREGLNAALPLTSADVEVTGFRLTHLNPSTGTVGVQVLFTMRNRYWREYPGINFSLTSQLGLVLR